MTSLPLPRGTRWRAGLVAASVAASLAACGGGSDAKGAKRAETAARSTVPCRATVDDAVGVAVAEYIKGAKPKPERFLISAGTDSALGDAGLTALQDKGPTYLFPGDPALQTQVRTQLHEKGDYTTLLVVRQGAEAKERNASVSLAGHYVGGEADGQHVAPRRIALVCDSVWRLADSSHAAGGAS